MLLLCLVAGCATVTPAEIAAADFGSLPAGYQERVKNVIGQELRDPFSATYRFGEPKKGFSKDGIAMGGKKHFGWIVPVGVNAKNGFGGYAGDELYYVMFFEGGAGDVTEMFRAGMAKFIE